MYPPRWLLSIVGTTAGLLRYIVISDITSTFTMATRYVYLYNDLADSYYCIKYVCLRLQYRGPHQPSCFPPLFLSSLGGGLLVLAGGRGRKFDYIQILGNLDLYRDPIVHYSNRHFSGLIGSV